jgi:serine/threonine-protein kinase
MEPASLRGEGQFSPKSCYGKYAIIRELGSGGMAHVFEGRHPDLSSAVAVKVLRPSIAAQPQAAARFWREAKVAAQIRHPNVVKVFDIGSQDGVPYMVMEFLQGRDLQTLLARKGPLPLTSIVELFLPIFSAVRTAHEAGVVHRDLKPANVMLTHRPPRAVHPFVLDFGISKVAGDDGEGMLTRSESLLGTVQYMAPELTRGAKFATAQSDQYALGVMLYECATGKRPFSGASHYELMHAIVTASLMPPSLVRSLPPEFDSIVLKAMSREPSQRFASVQALGRALLSLGECATWHIWQSEFVGALSERDLWSREAATDRDLASPSDMGRPPPNSATRWRPWRRLAAGLVVGGGMAGLLLAGSALVSRPRTAQAPLSLITAATSAGMTTLAAGSNANQNQTATEPPTIDDGPTLASMHPSAGSYSTSEFKKNPPKAGDTSNSTGQRPAASNTPAVRPPKIAPAARVGDPSSPTSNEPVPGTPQVGTNGAPIID